MPKCSICNRTFSTKRGLNVHLTTMHKDETTDEPKVCKAGSKKSNVDKIEKLLLDKAHNIFRKVHRGRPAPEKVRQLAEEINNL